MRITIAIILLALSSPFLWFDPFLAVISLGFIGAGVVAFFVDRKRIRKSPEIKQQKEIGQNHPKI